MTALSNALCEQEFVWAEMLSKLGTKLCRLSKATEGGLPKRRVAKSRSIYRELSDERIRLARELHAGAGQPLSGIKLNLEIIQESAADLSPRSQQALNRLQRLADQALEQLRAVSHRLHPPTWQEQSLAEAVENLVETSGISARFHVNVSTPPLSREPEHAVKIAIYRCVQECLSNIVRHSGASSITVSITEVGRDLHLSVSDDGHGFDAQKKFAGIGVRALEEHTSALGGRCRIQSGTKGTLVDIRMPFDGDT